MSLNNASKDDPDPIGDASGHQNGGHKTSHRRRLSRRKKLLFALAIVLLPLGMIELSLRLCIPRITWQGARLFGEDGSSLTADKSEWPATYAKGTRGTQVYLEFETPVAYNSDGFRGPDFDPTKGPVVMFVGDSTTAGHGVGYEEMFTVLVERALRDRFGNLQVWGLGRGGSGTVVHVRLLDRILKKYPGADVRLVVLVTSVSSQSVAGNDLTDLVPHMQYLEAGQPEERTRSFSLKRLARSCAIMRGVEILASRWRRENVRLPRLKNLDEL